MAVKQMILIPIYWGDWWLPLHGNSYSWAEVNGLLERVVGGRYMDGLNQYGLGRGAVSKSSVNRTDPPWTGFTDGMRDSVFRDAINGNNVGAPDSYDLATQQPFYCLIVKPGIQHLLDPSLEPDTANGAYHYPFQQSYWDGGRWDGQVCWVKADSTITGTIQLLVHEMAEAYAGHGEIADRCGGQAAILVDGVEVPRYWSVADNACVPNPDARSMRIVRQEQDAALLRVAQHAGHTTGPVLTPPNTQGSSRVAIHGPDHPSPAGVALQQVRAPAHPPTPPPDSGPRPNGPGATSELA